MSAASSENLPLVQLLLRKGAIVPRLFLHHLVISPEILQYFLENYALDIERKDRTGRTPLFTVLQSSSRVCRNEIVELLLQRGASVDKKRVDGHTPLQHALVRNRATRRILSLLVEYGSDLHAVDHDGKTIAQLCIEKSAEMLPKLISLGLNVNQIEALQLLLLKLETCLIGSTCVYQGEELALEDVQDIPVELMQDPWGIEFAPSFLGRDTCRTPMVWQKDAPNGGFSNANKTWLPIAEAHLTRAGLDEAKRANSVYTQFSEFLKWRKNQPAFMAANEMSEITGGESQIIFDRISSKQVLRCCFDFDTLTAKFEEL